MTVPQFIRGNSNVCVMRPYDIPPSYATGRRMLKSIWPCFASIASSRTQNLVASMMAKQPWGFTDDLLVLESTTSISFAFIEKIDSWTRAAFTVVLGSWCKLDRVHSETPCGASTEQALTASMKCSNNTLRVHSPVSLSFPQRIFGTFCYAGKSNNEYRRIMIYDLGVAERR